MVARQMIENAILHLGCPRESSRKYLGRTDKVKYFVRTKEIS